MSPLLRLSRLVWRDAANRYWLGAALVVTPFVYLYREWPPWVVREAVWSARPATAAAALTIVTVAYGVLAWGPTRQLVNSGRLQYWRQFPISPHAWRMFHGVHLAMLHGPIAAVALYLLLPLGVFWAGTIVGGVAAVSVAAAAHRLARPLAEISSKGRRVLPRVGGGRVAAVARLLLLVLIRRRGVIVFLLFAAQVGLAMLGFVATANLFEVDPIAASRTARGFGAVGACAGAIAVWVATDLLNRECWLTDAWAVRGRDWVLGSCVVAALVGAPSVLACTPISHQLPPATIAYNVISTATAGVVASLFAVTLHAQQTLSRQQSSRYPALLGLCVVLVAGISVALPWALTVVVPVAWFAATRRVSQASRVRQRLEIENPEDDHA